MGSQILEQGLSYLCKLKMFKGLNMVQLCSVFSRERQFMNCEAKRRVICCTDYPQSASDPTMYEKWK